MNPPSDVVRFLVIAAAYVLFSVSFPVVMGLLEERYRRASRTRHYAYEDGVPARRKIARRIAPRYLLTLIGGYIGAAGMGVLLQPNWILVLLFTGVWVGAAILVGITFEMTPVEYESHTGIWYIMMGLIAPIMVIGGLSGVGNALFNIVKKLFKDRY